MNALSRFKKENANLEEQIETMLEKVLKDEDDDCDPHHQTLHTIGTDKDETPSFIFEDNNRREKKLNTVNTNFQNFNPMIIRNEAQYRNEMVDSPSTLRTNIQRYNKKSRTYAYYNAGNEKVFSHNAIFQTPLIFDENVSDVSSQIMNSNINGINSFNNIR
jgi:hypothetical protein